MRFDQNAIATPKASQIIVPEMMLGEHEYTCLHMYYSTDAYIHVFSNTSAHIYIHIYTCILYIVYIGCINIYIYMYIIHRIHKLYKYMYIHVYVYIQICIYIYMCTRAVLIQ